VVKVRRVTDCTFSCRRECLKQCMKEISGKYRILLGLKVQTTRPTQWVKRQYVTVLCKAL